MGAPGSARWIAAQKAARVRLRNEMIARAFRRFVIALGVLLAALIVAPYAMAGDCDAVESASAFFGFVVGGAGGFVVGALVAVYRMGSR